MSKGTDRDFIPALRFHWLTSFYDPILRWTMRESTFKNKLVRQIQVGPGQRVLDLGCGTGTLTLLLKQAYPKAEVTGLDIDPKVLRAAEKKAENMGIDIMFHQGMSFELPYPDHSFDRVVTSLMFHHLTFENKLRTLNEAFRILKPQGELHIADWGKAQNWLMRIAFLSIQILDGFKTTSDNVNGLIPQVIDKAGFVETKETDRFMTLYGTLSLYKAKKIK
ncbi:class I SAM-dependent methyltransferase [Cohnella phaseoli]|uniref:Methyltransferase family protein n=1 Tax=Cohnella phaseoli TaxID=456490 RepID=A0A3D9JQD8_9BACL|nr:class I SAM-dependent methyltransferase [Cohnella phaseoli]RED76009.1 methyltransferase family protein [Cohnella phaseoli]